MLQQRVFFFREKIKKRQKRREGEERAYGSPQSIGRQQATLQGPRPDFEKRKEREQREQRESERERESESERDGPEIYRPATNKRGTKWRSMRTRCTHTHLIFRYTTHMDNIFIDIHNTHAIFVTVELLAVFSKKNKRFVISFRVDCFV